MKQLLAGPGAARAEPGKRRWLRYASVAVVFVAGLAVGVAFPDDTTELEAASSRVRTARGQIDELESDLAAAEEKNAALTVKLDEAQARAATAGTAAEATEKRLAVLEAKLTKRGKSLDDRERTLEQREQGLDETDQAPSVPEEPPAANDDFDRAYAVDIASDILDDIKSVDERLRGGGAVSSALYLLGDSYGRLLDAGIPPGVDESKYYGRVTTLQSFAEQAANMYDADPTQGGARYAVVRTETGVLLDQLNAAIGTDFRLP